MESKPESFTDSTKVKKDIFHQSQETNICYGNSNFNYQNPKETSCSPLLSIRKSLLPAW